MLGEKLKHKRIILASQSPRRQYLLKEIGVNFEIIVKEVEELFPETLKREEIPLFLAKKKADAFDGAITENTIVITADTIVWLENKPLNKPAHREEAIYMLKLLSGKTHEVITAVNLKSAQKEHSFYAVTKVHFKNLSEEEIIYYIDNYKPYDKAGAYGAQEWIGYIAVEKIEGSYFNVMGLPVKELYEELLRF